MHQADPLPVLGHLGPVEPAGRDGRRGARHPDRDHPGGRTLHVGKHVEDGGRDEGANRQMDQRREDDEGEEDAFGDLHGGLRILLLG